MKAVSYAMGSLVLLASKVYASSTTPSSHTQTTPAVPQKLVMGVDGGTESIRACLFDAIDGTVVGESCAVPYKTYHPKPGYAEQEPDEWWDNLGQAIKGALDSVCPTEDIAEEVKGRICAICIDTTCCSVVALDKENVPLRPSLLWMDARSAQQTKEILETCKGDPALKVNCNGEGPLSAEWMTPKALWIKQNEPEIWEKAKTICEYQDYMNYKLTGTMIASACNAATRWHWNGDECIKEATEKNKFPGRPMSLYKKLKIPELAEKLPAKCASMGDIIGSLTHEAARHLGLNEGTPVAQGGPDAFVGMVGLGCIYPQQLCLITGSSHLHCVVTAKPKTASGSWGAYRGAPITGTNFAEGGQSSTGSIIRWAKNLFGAEDLDYKTLDEEAAKCSPGSDGLIALETFQGSRTPVTDPLARGALVGLTLSHSRGHIWRALMEAVCFGTRACVDGLESAGHTCDEIIIAGGATRSPLWLQMHADVTGKPVVLCENIDAPLLGCAILASVGAGVHTTVQDAVAAMVRVSRRVDPNPDTAKEYNSIYNSVYSKVSSSVRPIVHSLAQLRGGAIANRESRIIISPSVLAADWANMSKAIHTCLEAGLSRLHVDIFDGVYLDSPDALTFGPQMVRAMRDVSSKIIMDVHLCVERPSRYIESLARAGANCVIFQYEAMRSDEEALELGEFIKANGMQGGVSINPSTSPKDIEQLLESELFSVIDILAVEPGFGGQEFQESAVQKLRTLKDFINRNKVDVKLMVDGGINSKTCRLVEEAGADIVVAGTFLFQHAISFKKGASLLMGNQDGGNDSFPGLILKFLQHINPF